MKIRKKTGNRVLWLSCMVVIMCIAGMVSAGAAAEWPQFQADNVNSGVTGDSAPITDPSGSDQSWVVRTTTGGWVGIDNCPVVGDGKVYVVPYTGEVQAYYLNGTQAWSTSSLSSGSFELSTPAYSENEDKLYVALCGGTSGTGTLYCLDADSGNIDWSNSTNVARQQTDTPITLDDAKGLLFFGTVRMGGGDPVNLSDDGTYFCYDTDGNFQWTRATTTGGGYYWAGAAVVGDNIVYGDDAGWLVSVDEATGNLIDSINVSSLFGVTSAEIRSSIVYSSTNGKIYFTSKGGYCYAVGMNTDGTFDTSTKWCHDIGYSTSTPTAYDGRVYVGHNGGFSAGTLYCLDAADGSEIWSNDDLGPIQSSPAISTWYGEPYIYVTTNSATGGLYCVDSSGSEVWHNTSCGSNRYCLGGTALSGGYAFFGNDAGYLHALAANTTYDFSIEDVGNACGDAVTALPTNASAPDQEFSSTDLEAIKEDDDTTADSNSTLDGQYAAQRFRFKVQSDEEPWVSALGATWIGTGQKEGSNGADLSIWNGTAYTLLASIDQGGEQTLAGSVTSDVDEYIDEDGYVTLLVKQKGAQTTDELEGTLRSYLETDYVKMEVVH